VGSKIAWVDRNTLTDEEILEDALKTHPGVSGRVKRFREELLLFEA